MTLRRDFLKLSACSIAGLASPAIWAGARSPGDSARLAAVSESFVFPRWLDAVGAAVAAGGSQADHAAWSELRSRACHEDASTGNPVRCVQALPAPGVELFPAAVARALSVESNDRLANRARFDARPGFATVSAFDPQAAQEAQRAIGTLGLSGISLGANRGMRLNHDALWPLYEYAQAERVPIYLPTSQAPGMAAISGAHQSAGITYGASAESAAHLLQLIFGGVLDAFPGLSVIVSRLGEATPHWHSRLERIYADSHDNGVRLPRRSIREYFDANIWLTTADMRSLRTLQYCSRVLAPGRILLSPEHLQAGQVGPARIAGSRVGGLILGDLSGLT